MYGLDTILQFHDGIWNVRSRCIFDKLRVVRVRVMIQMMIVEEVCQIFSVAVKFLRSQPRSLRYTTVNCDCSDDGYFVDKIIVLG